MVHLKSFLEIAIGEVEDERYLFRGQGEVSWSLTPGLFRGSSGRTPPEERIRLCEDFYGHHLPEFERYIKNDEPSWRELKVEYLVGLAQHVGLKTPLLDWTFSPFVALLFALMDWQNWGPDLHTIRIYKIDLNCVPEKVEYHHWSEVLPFDRVRAQQGTFVTVKPNNDFSDNHDHEKNYTTTCLDELGNVDEFLVHFDIELAKSDIVHAFSILDRCNINAGTMFPESIDRRFWVLQNRLELESR